MTRTLSPDASGKEVLTWSRDFRTSASLAILAKRLHTTNPAALRREVSNLQGDLLNKVKHKNITRRGKQNAAYLSRAKLDESTKKPPRAS